MRQYQRLETHGLIISLKKQNVPNIKATENIIKTAFDTAAPLASNYAFVNYNAVMTPQIYDSYSGGWSFI